MILQTVENNVESTLNGESQEFDIIANAKMFDLLSNKIYSHPIRAIIRELCCNAIDAHTDINNTDPIQVFLPTEEEQTLIIKDFGIGMTHDDIMSVYKTYGKSTKSSSAKPIGALGLGGKTPLAYTHQFSLSTSRDGTKNDYLIFRNEEGIPEVTLINSEPSNESGTTVELAVKFRDIRDFNKAAFITFIFFDQLPEIKRGEDEFYSSLYYTNRSDTKQVYEDLHNEIIALDRFHYKKQSPSEILFRNIISEYSTNFGIIMNQVFYTVDKEKLYESNLYGEFTKEAFQFPCSDKYNYYKICRIDSGAVSFQPSREALSYSSQTKDFLNKLFIKEFEDHVNTINSFKDSQDFVTNAKQVDFVTLTALSKKTQTNKILQSICEKYDAAVNHFFDSSHIIYLCAMFTNKHGRYNYQELQMSTISSKREIFRRIFTGEYPASIDIDEPDLYVKFLEKWANRKNNSTLVGLSSAIGKYVELSEKHMFLVTGKFTPYFKNNAPIEHLKLSDLVTKYDAENTVEKISGPRTYGKRNTDGKCWNLGTRSDCDIEDVIELLKAGEVTYELFEGEYEVKGYYYEPDFTNIGPKNSSVKNVVNDRWINRKTNVEGISLPKNHLYVDYTFFKKNTLWNLKNLYFYKDYFLKEMIELFTKIRDDLKNPVVWNNYVYKSNINNLISLGEEKYKGFKNTFIFKDYESFSQERHKKETVFSDLSFVIERCMKSPLFHREPYYISQYNQLALKLEEYSQQLIAEINATKEKFQKTSTVKKFMEKYPMFKFVSWDHVYDDDCNDYVDYIALIENLNT
jgi:hypothetical protein